MQWILEAVGVRKNFGALQAVAGTDLRLERGQITMLIGPNGSGKTTFINIVSGLYKPDAGVIIYNGTEIQGYPPHKIYDTGLVRTFQVPLAFVKLTVLENLLVAYRRNRGESFLHAPLRRTWLKQEEMITELAFDVMLKLKLDHLWDERSSNLSGGQFKLLEIGRALMSGAKTILMDEPVSGINPALAHEVLQHIKNLREQLGITFLLVEHRLDIALPYVEYLYAMDKGKVITHGAPDKVVSDPRVIESYLGG